MTDTKQRAASLRQQTYLYTTANLGVDEFDGQVIERAAYVVTLVRQLSQICLHALDSRLHHLQPLQPSTHHSIRRVSRVRVSLRVRASF